MDADPRRIELDPYVANLIRRKARQLVGHYGFRTTDREDIEEDLTVDLLRRMPNYDASRSGFRTFATRVVEHAVARMAEYRTAAVRDCRLEVRSLQETIAAGDGEQLPVEDLPHEDASLVQRGHGSGSSPEEQDLRIDLDRALGRLTMEQRELCLQLMTSTISEIASAKGMSRARLYEIRREIQAVFEQAGLREYL